MSDVLNKAEGADVLLIDGEQKFVAAEYSYDKMTINGVNIKEYKIIYPSVSALGEKKLAASLQSYITEKTGYTLVCESDKSQSSEHEINIGQTNRITQAMLTQRESGADGENYYAKLLHCQQFEKKVPIYLPDGGYIEQLGYETVRNSINPPWQSSIRPLSQKAFDYILNAAGIQNVPQKAESIDILKEMLRGA